MNKQIDNKAIEEMAKVIDQAQKQGYQRIFEETRKFVQENHRYSSKNDYDKAHSQTIDEIIAEALYNAGYLKVNEGEVVLNKDELAELTVQMSLNSKKMAEIRKETAKEILQWLVDTGLIEQAPDTTKTHFKEKYGVEVE